MTQPLVLHEDERERKAGEIKVLSLGLLTAAGVGEVSCIILWLFNRDFLIIPLTLVVVAAIVICLITYWLVRIGKVKTAGYFFIVCLLLESAIITPVFGGFQGPMAITYLFSILVAGMAIGVNAGFIVATLATVLYLGMIPVQQAGLLPQLLIRVTLETGGDAIPYLTVGTRVVFFYLVAFLSWFAASRLNRALQDVCHYAAELQTANEKLQASEEELRTSNEELQAANEELREAQEQLVRSEKLAAIGQLAGGVGHELRNPLGAIKNAVYYIKGKVAKSELAQKEPRVAEFLDIMDDEINSSNKIINDLLGFSRVGKPALSPAMIEMVIDDAIAHTQMPESIELTKRLDTSLPEVEIDTDQVRQVLVNIITNAVQAMPEGGKLTIGARAVDNFLQVEITDTGVGIPEDAIEKVFDPLYTTRAKGIGLGLAVCQSIIERHEGHIEVASKMGKGTTFTVRLPLKAR